MKDDVDHTESSGVEGVKDGEFVGEKTENRVYRNEARKQGLAGHVRIGDV